MMNTTDQVLFEEANEADRNPTPEGDPLGSHLKGTDRQQWHALRKERRLHRCEVMNLKEDIKRLTQQRDASEREVDVWFREVSDLEAKEKSGIPFALIQARNALREQRDELLEALKLVRSGFPVEDEAHWMHWAISEKTLSIVKEAIRKAGGDS